MYNDLNYALQHKITFALKFTADANNLWNDYLHEHTTHYDFVNHEDHMRLVVKETTKIPISISILIGIAFNQLRSTLDHAIWALAKPRKGVETAIQFPIFNDQATYEKKKLLMLDGVANSAIALIDSVQPYTDSHEGKILRFLSAVTNADKHRILLAAEARLDRVVLNSVTSGTINLQREVLHAGKMKPGFVMADIWFGYAEKGDTFVINPEMLITPVFDLPDIPLVDGCDIFERVSACTHVVREKILPRRIAS